MKSKVIMLALAACSFLTACEKYLDAKPDKKMVVPATLQDVQAMLDNTFFINNSYSPTPEIAADNYFLSYSNWNGISNINERGTYIWDKEAVIRTDWAGLYKIVFIANTALETLAGLRDATSSPDALALEATALFFRGYTFYQLAELFAKPYSSQAIGTPGIPLRLSPNLEQETTRASLGETYDRILTDLKAAVRHLPRDVRVQTRPSKAAGYAALARVYLAMQDYEKAGAYADSSLQLHPYLMDYNTIEPTAAFPFALFNPEVIFHVQSLSVPSLYYGQVDTVLYASYAADDLRKALFFAGSPGNTTFKGHYYGGSDGSVFSGIASDEMYLVKAESEARLGMSDQAMETLNTLLRKRWKEQTFSPRHAGSADEALALILEERRKELPFRGLRWYDLRRLNQDPRFAKTLVRQLEVQTYKLLPQDKRYVLLIPEEVITMTGIVQNER